jgi:hypothetical protein
MKARLLLLAVPPVITAVLSFPLPSSSTGIYWPNLVRQMNSCGFCHYPTPGAPAPLQPIRVSLQPSARVLAGGQSVQIALSATGGQSASTNGGFSMDATAGTFSAGPNTQVMPPGDAITHASSASRSWNFGYTAPNAPGLVEMHAVVNTVDNDLNNDDDDRWAFHGFDDTATQVTPVRLYVNARNVAALGRACAGSFGNVPVLGAPTSPAIGNAAFSLALHGAAPASVTGLMLGVVPFPTGLDLSLIGVTGCSLFVDPVLTFFGTTGAGDAQRGEGAASFSLPIPNDPGLVAAVLYFQAFVFDVANGRPLPLTLTNALAATIQ